MPQSDDGILQHHFPLNFCGLFHALAVFDVFLVMEGKEPQQAERQAQLLFF